MAWQLAEGQDPRTPEEKERYAQYEAALVAAHIKTWAQIDADGAAAEFDEPTKLRQRRLARKREDEKIKKLQAEYRI